MWSTTSGGREHRDMIHILTHMRSLHQTGRFSRNAGIAPLHRSLCLVTTGLAADHSVRLVRVKG